MPTLAGYLGREPVAMPAWLDSYGAGVDGPVDGAETLRAILNSRTVYYPGSGFDGGPVATFNTAHAAHAYVYVDDGLPEVNSADLDLGLVDTSNGRANCGIFR